MKKFIVAVLFTACFFTVNAQDSLRYQLADYYLEKSDEAFNAEEYDSACYYAGLHQQLELGFDNPRGEKMVLSYITLAFCEFREGRYKQAIEVYNQGIKWSNSTNSAAFAKAFFDFIDLCYQQMESTDSVYYHYTDKDYRKTFLFRIQEVVWQQGTKFRVRINGGLNDGVIMGAVAFPISAPVPDSVKQRLFQLGKGEIVSVGPWSSEAEIDIYDSTDVYNWVQEGDIIETRIFSKFKDETIIYQLLADDVSFRDNDRERLLNPRYIIHYDSKEFKELLLLLMADQVLETEEFTREGDIFINPAPRGQNQGKSIHDLFLEPDTGDIMDYLEFVEYFPRKYMGKDYKVNETYATWLLNNSPTTPMVVLDSLLREPDAAKRRQIWENNRGDMDDDDVFYEKWADAATEYASKQEYAMALLVSDMLMEASDFYSSPKIRTYASHKRAAIYKTMNRYQEAINWYDTAERNYLLLGDTLEHIRYIYKAADVYEDWGRYKQAVKLFDKALNELNRQIGKKGTYDDWELMAYILWDKGYTISQDGDNDGALKAYLRAEKILDSIGGSKSDRATLYRNMAFVSKKKGMYKEALEKYRQSMELFLAVGNQEKYATANDDIADTYFKMGEYRTAVEYYNKAFDIKMGLDDKSGAGFSRSNIGQAYWNLGEYDSAIMFHSEAVELRKAGNDIVGTAYSLEKIADLWKENGKFDSALNYYLVAESYYIVNNDTTDKLASLKEAVGNLYYKMKNYDQAIYFYKRALQIYTLLNNEPGMASNLYNLGVSYYYIKSHNVAEEYLIKSKNLYDKMRDKENNVYTLIYLSLNASEGYNDYKQGEKLMKDALALAKETNSLTNQGYTWQQLGYLKNSQGQMQMAKKYYDSSLTIYNQSGDYSGAGYTKLKLGYYYIDNGEFGKARDLYRAVADTAITKKNYLLASNALISLADYYNLTGEYDSAKAVANQSLSLNKEIKNDYIEAGAYISLGNTYNYLADYKTAVKYYYNADSIYIVLKDPTSRATPKNNLGTIYFYQGDYRSALIQFSEVYKQLKDINYEGDFLITALVNMGEVYMEDGVWPEADKWLKLGLTVSAKIKNKRGIAASNLLLGKLRLKQKKYAEAKTHLTAAYADYNKMGEKERIIEVNTFIGKLYYETNKNDSAKNYLDKAIEVAKQTGNTKYQWEPLYISSSLYLRKKDTAAAVAALKSSIDILENIKGKIAGRSSNLVSFAKAQDKFKIYQQLVDLLVSQNDVKMAFYYQEKANITGLISQTRGDDNGPKRGNDLLDEAQEDHAKDLEMKIDGYYAELIKERSKPKEKQSAEKIKTLEGLIDVNETDYNKFTDSALDATDGGHKVFTQTINPRELDDARFSLGDGDAVIEYLATENQLIIFVATNNSLHARKVNIKQTDLKTAVTEFYAQVSNSKTDAKIVTSNSNKLYQVFIEPIADLIAGKKRLALVPTSFLYMLPIDALGKQADGKMHYLITDYEIAFTNNLKFIYAAQADGKIVVKGLLCFGNADNTLSNAEKEVNDISALFPSTIFLRDSASEDKAKLMMGNYTIVHYATHGKLDPVVFGNSYLVLAPNTVAGDDGRLTMSEIREIKTLRGIRLLVLSACDMAAMEDANTNEWMNTPANEFIMKGVGSVVAPQWKVHDEATSLLMVEFYKNLQGGMGVSEALKTSQLKLAENEKFSHPYYWAAFENYGKW